MDKSSMKKLVIILFVCVVAIVAIKNRSIHKKQVSSLLLYNIEALAADENIGTRQCFGIGSVDCPVFHTKVEYVFGGYSLEE